MKKKERGARTGRPRYQPTPETLARLGKVSDAVLAREVGVSPSVIRAIRVGLGIGPKRSDLREAIVRLLAAGKDTQEIMKLAGVTRQYISRLRKENPPCPPVPAGDGTPSS